MGCFNMDNNIVDNGIHSFNQDECAYIPPRDELVAANLEKWQNMKLGLMVHFGIYSQWGIVESWALSRDDAKWSRTDVSFPEDELLKRYDELIKTFNPVMLDPAKWADVASNNGFKYFIFSTKHHDGFAMYDTQFSDFKITSKDCPFHAHPYANMTRCLFDEFRKKDMKIGVYFSKPDWHSPYYWEPGKPYGHPSRGPTYSPAKDKEKWARFSDFVHNQLEELTSEYGPVDILWLDGGWVNPLENAQDINMPRISKTARDNQPGLIIVDRTVGGEYENYVTPEQTIPKTPMLIPWEACITLGTSFSYKFDDTYKSSRELIHLLIEVVAKGGNLALNAGAQPNGMLPAPVISCMKAVGEWLACFGEAIYNTRSFAPYFTSNMGFTRNKQLNRDYVIRMVDENEQVRELVFPYDKKVEAIKLLGSNIELQYEHRNGIVCVDIPEHDNRMDIAFAVVIDAN